VTPQMEPEKVPFEEGPVQENGGALLYTSLMADWCQAASDATARARRDPFAFVDAPACLVP